MTRSSRRPAFDISALDDLDEILPPAPSPDRSSAVAEQAPARAEVRSSATTPPPVVRRASRATTVKRGGGGVDPGSTADGSSSRVRTVAVRIPRELYMAVQDHVLGAAVERPSYAQLVTWTVEDHPEDALVELREQLARAARVPRGRRLAADSVPIAPRFQPHELAVLDQLISDAGGASRTDAIVAAFRVALRHT
jgi:hypothetical protein